MTHPPVTRRTGLNRTPLLGDPWQGRPAGRVLGAVGLARQVRDLIPGAAAVHDPLALLEHGLARDEPAAQEVADRWTRALARLLRSLTLPDAADRAARQEWGEEDWARWSAVSRVVLGGGVVAGQLGRRAVDSPRVRELPVEVVRSPDPARAPLIGLAAARPVRSAAVLLDLGHSSIKAATVSAGGAVHPEVRLPVPWHAFNTDTWPSPEELVDLIAKATCQAVTGSWSASGTEGGIEAGPLEVRVAIANYVTGGVLDDDETYGGLARLEREQGPGALPDPDPSVVLGRALSGRLDRHCVVSMLLNDGQAAALTVEQVPSTAVVCVGTSLGLGFPRA